MHRLRYDAGMRCTIRTARLILTTALAGLLAACGSSDNDPGPGGVTVGEARALDEAAEMIESRRPPAEPTEETVKTPTEKPAG